MRLVYTLFLIVFVIYKMAKATESKSSFSVSLGVVSTTGNSQTTTIRGSINYSYKGDIWREYLKLSGLYGTSNGRKNAERLELWGRIEKRFFPYFLFFDVDYYRNPFQGYLHSIGYGPGVGVYIFRNEDIYLSVSYYVYSIYNKLTGTNFRTTTGSIEKYFLHHIEERFRVKITNNLKFKQRIIYKVTSRTFQDYFITAENSIENRLLAKLFLEVSYNVNYQNIPVEQNIKRLDTIFMTSIKYSF